MQRAGARQERINAKERDRYIRALERNRDGVTARIEEIQEDIATLRVFVRELKRFYWPSSGWRSGRIRQARE